MIRRDAKARRPAADAASQDRPRPRGEAGARDIGAGSAPGPGQAPEGAPPLDASVLLRRAKALGHRWTGQTRARAAAPPAGSTPNRALPAGGGPWPGVPGGAVQRAVGFEFELDSTQSGKTGLSGDSALKKGQVLADLGDFTVTADEVPPDKGKGTDVEIIIKEVDDRDPAGAKKLSKTAGRVVTLLDALDGLSGKIPASRFHGPSNLWVSGAFNGGMLQATAGLDLDALAKFRSGEMGRHHEQVLGTMGPRPGDPLGQAVYDEQAAKALYLRKYGAAEGVVWHLSLGWAKKLLKHYSADQQRQLAGVLSMIATIPVTAYAAGPVPYPKSATGNLLARTDLATVVGQLSVPVQSAIVGDDFVTTLLKITSAAAASDTPLGRTDPVFPKGTVKYGDKEPVFTLTLGEWFSGLAPPFPVDKLTKVTFPEEHGGRKQGEWLESMGGFGSKMDPALEKEGPERPIFEFRRPTAILTKFLPQVTMGIWELVALAHGED